jgi:hypothetical protein
VSIHLSPSTESRLAQAAQARGTTPDLLAEEFVRERLEAIDDMEAYNPDAEGPQTLAEQLADFIGVLHSGEDVAGGARMSVDPGKRFAEGMLRKRAQGRL